MMEKWKLKYYKQRFKLLNEESTKHLDTADLMIDEMEHIAKELDS